MGRAVRNRAGEWQAGASHRRTACRYGDATRPHARNETTETLAEQQYRLSTLGRESEVTGAALHDSFKVGWRVGRPRSGAGTPPFVRSGRMHGSVPLL